MSDPDPVFSKVGSGSRPISDYLSNLSFSNRVAEPEPVFYMLGFGSVSTLKFRMLRVIYMHRFSEEKKVGSGPSFI